MLDKGASPHEPMALVMALLLPAPGPALLLLNAGAELRPDPSLLTRCAKRGFVEVLQLLLARGADPNAGNMPLENGMSYRAAGISALMSAFLNDSLEAAEMLLKAGADPLVVAQTGSFTQMTVMHYAKSTAALQLLFRYMPNAQHRALLINWCDPQYKLTSLHLALTNATLAEAQAASLKVLRVLVEAGGDVTVRDKDNRDLVAFASSRGSDAAHCAAIRQVLGL